jgi:hypothetical protein
MRTLKYIIAVVIAIAACIASTTDLVAANQAAPKLHKLKVVLKDRKGVIFIHFYFSPSAGARLVDCDVVIHQVGQGTLRWLPAAAPPYLCQIIVTRQIDSVSLY